MNITRLHDDTCDLCYKMKSKLVKVEFSDSLTGLYIDVKICRDCIWVCYQMLGGKDDN